MPPYNRLNILSLGERKCFHIKAITSPLNARFALNRCITVLLHMHVCVTEHGGRTDLEQ